MAQDRNTTPHLNNDHEVTAISQRLAHAANVDEEETSETQTDTDVEMLEAGTTEEFIPVDKEPHEQATKSASVRKRVATRGDRKAPATKPTLPRLYFHTFALEALEGLYGHQERLIAEEAFPSKKANRKGNKAAFDAAKANEGSLSAVRYLMMKVDMLQAQVDEAKDENVGHRKKERGYLKYIANDIDDVLGKKPVTDDVVAGMLSAQGTDESTIEQVLEQIMEEVKKQRDQ